MSSVAEGGQVLERARSRDLVKDQLGRVANKGFSLDTQSASLRDKLESYGRASASGRDLFAGFITAGK